jgi:hypothetical protein
MSGIVRIKHHNHRPNSHSVATDDFVIPAASKALGSARTRAHALRGHRRPL